MKEREATDSGGVWQFIVFIWPRPYLLRRQEQYGAY